MDEISTVTTGARRFRTRRRRFLLVATAALAAVAAAMGISFTADTGTSTVTVSAGSSSSLVFTVADHALGANILPADGTGTSHPVIWGGTTATSALAYATTAHTTSNQSAIDSSVLPNWSPVAGAAGTVTSAGDLFVIDGRTESAGGSGHITVNVYVTNLADLQKAYSSFAWPVDLYVEDASTVVSGSVTVKGGTGDGTNGGSGGWHMVDATHPTGSTMTVAANTFYLTNTGGFLSYYLPTGADRFYEIALDAAGSFYTVNSGTAANLRPTFFVTAQAT